MSSFTGGPGADVYHGGGDADVISGLAGADTLFGEGGADVIDGGAGMDVLDGGTGADTLLGGDDPDILYGDLGDLVLDGGGGDDAIQIAGLPDGEVRALASVNGGAGNDHIMIMTSLAGTPTLTLNGGDGNDWVDLSRATGPVTIDLRLTGAQQTDLGSFIFQGIESVTAGDHGSVLNGDDADNYLSGGEGNDVLNGYGGSNSLYGRGGDDIIHGGANGETLSGGTGDDIVDGGGGGDIYLFDFLSGGITLDLEITGPQNTGEGMDVFRNILQFDGEAWADTFKGDGGVNVFFTMGGADKLYGRGGDDFLVAGSGDDLIDGGDGNDNLFGQEGSDTLNGGRGVDAAGYDGLRSEYTIVTVGGTTTVTGRGYTDTLTSIELIGFNDGAIELPREELHLSAGAGGGRLEGGDGADVLTAGAGDDILDGGVGVDVASFAAATHEVVVDLSLAGPQSTGAGVDTLIDIEGLTGSAFSDVLSGSSAADTLAGGEGQDWLKAGGGQDVLAGDLGDDSVWGGAGDDVLDGGAGNDTLYGGDGVDTVTYQLAEGRVEVDLSIVEDQLTRGAGVDTLVSIENLIGSNYDDVLSGGFGMNRIDGGAGDDILRGGGADVLTGGAGADTFVLDLYDSRMSDQLLITDFASGDRIDLSGIDANTAAPGDQAFTLNRQQWHAGDIFVAYSAFDEKTWITLHTGDGAYDTMQFWLAGDHSAITAADFIL